MSRPDLGRSRARPCGVWLALFLAFQLSSAGEAAGQVTPAPGDTVPADTIVAPGPVGVQPGDTVPSVPSDTVRVPGPIDVQPGDTVPTAVAEAARSEAAPPAVLGYPDLSTSSWASARWELRAEEIARLPGLTLLEIVERLPGLVGFRAGGYGRPEGLTAVGLGGSRVRVIVDGLEMTPIGGGTFELESIPLLDIERVVVERDPAGVVVDVRTFRFDQPDAHSVVELGTGVYQTRVLRALFSRGFGSRSVGTGTFDLVSTRGSGIREPYSHSSAVFRYGLAPTSTSAVQAEWRRATIDRQGTLFPRQTTRTDVTVRGRLAVRDDLVLEALLARVREDEGTEGPGAYDIAINEGGLRGAFSSAVLSAETAVRIRSGDEVLPPAASFDAEGSLAFTPVRFLRAEAKARTASAAGLSASRFDATGVFSPVPALSVFASMSSGERLLGHLIDGGEALAGEVLVAAAGGWRAGAELATAPLAAGVAAFHHDGTVVLPFGLGFDRGLPALPVGPLDGVEGWFEAPVPGTARALAIEGSYVRAPDGLDRPYTPVELARAGIRFHAVYYGGQLEPLVRIEAVHRGRARVPAPDILNGFDGFAPAYQTLNLSLQLRILDIQAFLLWDNLVDDSSAIDLLGVPRAVPRIVYGGEWRFRG